MNALPRTLLGIYGLVLLAVVIGGGWFYRAQEQQVRARATADLESIGRNKVAQIVRWRAERLGDAALLMGSPLFGEAVLRLLADPGSGDAERIMAQFRTMQAHHPYRDIVLLDGRGQVVLRSVGTTAEFAAPVLRALEEALRSGQPVVSDLFQEAGRLSPSAMVVAPLCAGAAPGEAPFAVVLLPVDVQDFLYPVTQTWPTPTRSGETLFVRREGDDVLFLNPLRRDARAAFKLRIPLNQRGVPAVEAVLGVTGVMEGRDYAGAPVWAALAAVPDSPWFIVTKIETEEALADWRFRARLIVAVLVLLAGVLGGLIGLVWLQRAKYQTLLEAAAVLREREARLRDVLELNEKLLGAATAGIEVFKASGSCVMANATAARIVGGTVEALREQNFRRIPSWEQSGLLAAAERALATRQGQQLEISIHTTFGCDRWLDCSLSPFEAGGEPHLLLIFHDITQRQQAEALRSQLSQIIEATSDFVATASPEGQIRYFNRTARRLFGLGDGDDPSTHSIEKSHPAWAAKRVLEEGIPAAIRDGTWTGETAFLSRDGREIPHTQVIVAHRAPDGSVAMISTVARDISDRKKNEELMQARLRLLEAAPTTSLNGFLQLALDEIEARTGSTIGFYHFMDADQETLTLQGWSSNTVRHMCTAEGQGQHYPVSKAGVWVDCVRERRAVIHNDYAALAHKRGLPAGHSPITRQLVVPILRGDRIVAIIGVGNKPTGYGQPEVEIATLLGDFSWEMVERKRAEAELVEMSRLQTAILDGAGLGIVSTTTEGMVTTFSAGAEKLLGYARAELIGKHTPVVYHLPNEVQARASELSAALGAPVAPDFAVFAAQPQRGLADEREWTFVRKDGGRVPVWQTITALRDGDGAITGFLSIARDLTERKHADEALQVSEERLRKVLGQADCLVWEAQVQLTAGDWSWRFTIHASGLYLQLFGVEEPNQSTGLWQQFEVPELAEIDHRSRAAMEAGLPGYRQVFRVVRDGRQTWIRESVSITRLEEGRFWLVGVATDITEQKRAEEARVVNQRRLQLAVETAGIGIWDWDIGRNTVEWDAQMHRFYGMQPRADLRVDFQQWADAVLPEDLPEQLRILQGIAHAGGRSEREFRIRRADNGKILYLQAAEVCVTDGDGRPVHVVGVNLDITPRKEAETALHRAQQLLQLVLDTIPLGVIWKDRELRYLGCNRRAARDAGLADAREILGREDGDLAWRAMAEAYRADDRRVVDSGAALTDFEEKIVQPDGRVFWVRTNKIPLRDADGAVFGVLGTYEDISLRKRLELEQLKLLAELSRSNTDLEQFAYVASHDLKSPLRAIDSLAGWLQEDLESVLTGDSRKHLELLRQRTHRMERLLDDLLAYSRAGRVPADIVAVDVARLVGEIVEMLNRPEGFTVRLNPPAPVFATAVTPLRQVLTNLIANAIKHHDKAGGLIEIAVREAGEWFEFTVADDGPGIPPEFHERIFGMFQTLRPRDQVEGSGIGLALVRRIVARYGGKATVAVRAPRGSVFCFQWPKTISTDEPHSS